MNSATGENQGYSTVQSAHVNRANKYTCNGDRDSKRERERENECVYLCVPHTLLALTYVEAYICGMYLMNWQHV